MKSSFFPRLVAHVVGRTVPLCAGSGSCLLQHYLPQQRPKTIGTRSEGITGAVEPVRTMAGSIRTEPIQSPARRWGTPGGLLMYRTRRW